MEQDQNDQANNNFDHFLEESLSHNKKDWKFTEYEIYFRQINNLN